MDFKAGGTLEKRDLSASSTGRITTPIASRFAVSSATSTLLNHDRSGLVAHRGEESFRVAKHAAPRAVVCVRQNGPADLFWHVAFRQDRFALHRMIGRLRMDFPIEIMQQRSNTPLRSIPAEFQWVAGDASLHSQRVPAETVRFREFAQNIPSLVPIHRQPLS